MNKNVPDYNECHSEGGSILKKNIKIDNDSKQKQGFQKATEKESILRNKENEIFEFENKLMELEMSRDDEENLFSSAFNLELLIKNYLNIIGSYKNMVIKSNLIKSQLNTMNSVNGNHFNLNSPNDQSLKKNFNKQFSFSNDRKVNIFLYCFVFLIFLIYFHAIDKNLIKQKTEKKF